MRRSVCLALGVSLTVWAAEGNGHFHPQIRKTWDDSQISTLEVPLARPEFSPRHISSDFYYQIPVRPVFRTYPIYGPGHEPPGYMNWLVQQEPQETFHPATFETRADWVRAGELVFEAPIAFNGPISIEDVHDPEWYQFTGTPLASDGTLPYLRYVIRKKGQVEVGNLSCASCHIRLMPDGTILKGAQGNFPFDRAWAARLRHMPRPLIVSRETLLFAVPWQDARAHFDQFATDEIIRDHLAVPPGVISRHRTSFLSPVQVPDLIGVSERKYLDRTGLQLQRDIGDLMRYAALNQGADNLAHFGSFHPAELAGITDPQQTTRYSDEQLYAMALYIYLLKPPTNPNSKGALARQGEQIFQAQGCPLCHTPPLYTNNKLTPVRGFVVPDSLKQRFDILPIVVGTDPTLALETRRGTGFYKVPSLRGVWYRGPLEHNGSVATLEDWFDAARLRDDYTPTGFIGPGKSRRAVPGHPFGLGLSPEDKAALIAFLRTL